MKPRPLFASFAMLVAWFASATPAFSAPPANDNYASAQAIAGVPIDLTGNNTEATLEPGEVDPGEYGGASVWYSWTAPSTGWFTVHTSSNVPGNGLDTVLALFADGPNIASAPMIGHNDDSVRQTDFPEEVYPNPIGPSRLVFWAVEDTVFKIAVHGFGGGVSGPFDLHIASESTPEFVVSSVSFSPSTADITSSSVNTTATVSIQTAAAFSNDNGSYANIYLLRPWNGTQASTDYIEESNRFDGTDTDGLYTASLTVPRYEQPGDWPVNVQTYSSALGDDIEWTSPGNDIVEDDYIIPQFGSHLIVDNAIVDSAPPHITLFTGLPPAVELADGDAEFQIFMDATDDFSGVVGGKVWLIDGVNTRYELAFFDGLSLTNGTDTDGEYTLPVVISASSLEIPPGTYQVEVEIGDRTTNQRYYGPSDTALPGGSSTTITISATPGANDDFDDRVVLGSSLPVSELGTTRFATLEPGESNLDDSTTASGWYEWTALATGWVSIDADGTNFYRPIVALHTGTDLGTLQELGRNDASIEVGSETLPLVFQAQAGTTYKIAVCGAGVGNNVVTGDFELKIAVAPTPTTRVTGFLVTPPTVDVATGDQEVTVEFTMESDIAVDAFDFMYVYLTPDASIFGTNTQAGINASHRISGTDTLGTYRATLTIPGWYEPGIWNLIIDTYVDDGFYQWTPQGPNIVQDAFLIPAFGGGVDVQNSVGVDEDAPVLVSVTGLPSYVDISSPASVTIFITATDDVSGIESGQVILSNLTESTLSSYGMGSFGPADLLPGGTPTNGVYEVELNLTGLPPGDYDLEIRLTDFSDKLKDYGPYNDPMPGGSTVTVTLGLGSLGYAGWADTQDFGSSGLEAELDDANGDGTVNLLCYAFNLPPYTSRATTMVPGAGNTAGLPSVTVIGSGATRRIRIEYLRRIGDSGLTYRPQFGSDLSNSGPNGWQDAAPTPPETIDSEWERVVVEDSVTGTSRRFGRVLIEYTAP